MEVSDLERLAMQEALVAAHAAAELGEVPVGAAAIYRDEIITVCANEREATHDPTAHAELLALRYAATQVGNWRLNEITIVVTLEPCTMCAGAMVNARLGRLVFGTADLKAGAGGSRYNVLCDPRLNHEVDVVSGLEAQACAKVLQDFFALRRT